MNPQMAHQMPPQYRAQVQAQAQAQAQAHMQAHQRMHSSQKRGHHGQQQHPQQAPKPVDERYLRQQEAQKEAIQAEADKRRAAAPTDKNMPPGVEDLIIGDGVEQYARLREVERKLDAIMMRKRLDLQDPLQNRVERYSTLKIWISNTVENQPWQGRGLGEDAFDFNTDVEATYKVKIEGHVVEDDNSSVPIDLDDEGVPNDGTTDAMEVDGEKEKSQEEGQEQSLKKRIKLSHFFKAITIDFDRNKNLQPDGLTQIEWKKPRPPQSVGGALNPPISAEADFDNLQFERKSDENINCTINLFRDDIPERFKLSKPLSRLLDTEEADRPGIIWGLWEYAKAMGLQSEEEKRIIRCDDLMKAVFNSDTVYFPDLQKALEPHIHPLPPISLPYTIRCDPGYHNNPTPTIYVLRLRAPPTPTPAPASLAEKKGSNVSTNGKDGKDGEPNPDGPGSPSQSKGIETPTPDTLLAALTDKSFLDGLRSSDAHIALLIQAISDTQSKHAFFNGMARDPVAFTKRWMVSQRRDLETVLGESGRFEGEWASGAGSGSGDSRGALRADLLKGGDAWRGRQVEDAVAMMVGRKGSDGRSF